MAENAVILKAYYELLYERLLAGKDALAVRMKELLSQETARLWKADPGPDKIGAYYDACLAFLEERLEMYNPFGLQYTFERVRAKEAVELEYQLNWYDSRSEFRALREAIKAKAAKEQNGPDAAELAGELIAEVGAFPDKSIIFGYEAAPAPAKLPDYVLARAIEETVR